MQPHVGDAAAAAVNGENGGRGGSGSGSDGEEEEEGGGSGVPLVASVLVAEGAVSDMDYLRSRISTWDDDDGDNGELGGAMNGTYGV